MQEEETNSDLCCIEPAMTPFTYLQLLKTEPSTSEQTVPIQHVCIIVAAYALLLLDTNVIIIQKEIKHKGLMWILKYNFDCNHRFILQPNHRNTQINWYVLHCLRFLELAHLLDMVHKVSTIHILHDKVQAVLWSCREEKGERRVMSVWKIKKK